MKNQKVVLDNWKLVYTTTCYLLLAFAGWIFIRLVTACIKYPRFMRSLRRMNEETDKDDTLKIKKAS